VFPSTATTTWNYTFYLRQIASTGSVAEIVSAMAPCPWAYLEVAERLSKNYIQIGIYKKWIQFYSPEESSRQVKEIKMMFDTLAKEASEKDKMMIKTILLLHANTNAFFGIWLITLVVSANRVSIMNYL
jgi:thiaminase